MAQEITVDSRLAAALARKVAGERLNVTALCAELMMSRERFYVFERRYREGGLQAVLEPLNKRPHSSPTQTPAEVEDLIVQVRKELAEEGWDVGARSIQPRLGGLLSEHPLLAGCAVPSLATINRVLVRRGMVTPAPEKRPKSAMRRFEYPNPNACWQVDATDWLLADGTPVSIVQVLDDCSRKLLAHDVAAGETTVSVWAALSRAIDRYGLPFQVLTDKGAAMLGWSSIVTQIRHNLTTLGVKCVTSRGNHPQTCGKNERVHQTLHTWLEAQHAKGRIATTISELQSLCDEFETLYNRDRPHQALHGQTPDERYNALPKLGPGAQLDPPAPVVVRNLVSARGIVSIPAPNGGQLQLGIGRRWEGTQVIVLRQELHAAVFHQHQVIAEFTLNPDRIYQPANNIDTRPRTRRKLPKPQTRVSGMS